VRPVPDDDRDEKCCSPTIRAYRRRMREATSRVTDSIGEAFAAVQAIKVAGRTDDDKFPELGEERRRRALADVLLTERSAVSTTAWVSSASG